MKSFFNQLRLDLRSWNHARLERRHAHRAVEIRREVDVVRPEPYVQWTERHDTLTPEVREALGQRLRALRATPTLAIVMPVYNPHPAWLEEAIASVRGQLYPHWELCIADDASTDPRIRVLLEQAAASDARIKVAFRPTNGHISACSNSALALVSAPFFGLLDHDDVLREHALLLVAEALQRWPDALAVYSDEDKLSPTGQRCDPYFKPDWNPELMWIQNYLCHFTVLNTAHCRERGAFRVGFEGSQDHDLFLRCTRGIAAARIVHIPHVLYHWRQHEGSTSLTAEIKPYSFEARRRAVQDHLDASGVSATAEVDDQGRCRVRWAALQPQPRVSIIIPTRNGNAMLNTCIRSIFELTEYDNYEILIVDNGSDDPETLQALERFNETDKVRVIRDERPFNYSAINNRAVKHTAGEFVALVNDDIEVISPGWLHEMVAAASQPGVGAVGAKLWFPNKTLQHGGVVLGLGGVAGHCHKHAAEGDPGYMGHSLALRAVSAVTGACLVVKRAVFDEVGGLDEDALAVAFNDVDFCIKLLVAGYRNVWTPHAELYHHESVSRGADAAPDKRQRFLLEIAVMKERWGPALMFDPMFSPNLTIEREDTFGLAEPPQFTLRTPWFETRPRLPQLHEIDTAARYRTPLDLANRNDESTLIVEHARAHAPAAARLLEVGCKSGDLGYGLRQLGFHVTGIETRASAAAAAFHKLDDVYLGSLQQYLAGAGNASFDLIVMPHMLEHAPEPVPVLERLRQRLSPGGAMVISIPNITHVSVVAMLLDGKWNHTATEWLRDTHRQYFDESGMRALFESAGLSISTLSTTTATATEMNAMLQMNLSADCLVAAERVTIHANRHVVRFVATCTQARERQVLRAASN
jgi:GT2 family glycosyltransferase/2-polyprenyl-3-methyl-5-hydroxy-6-metoxy-1,4-benzoquinol methylase